MSENKVGKGIVHPKTPLKMSISENGCPSFGKSQLQQSHNRMFDFFG